MRVYSKVETRKVKVGGDQHSGWLPDGSSTPLPTPIKEVKMTFEITDDGGGNFLLIYESEDKSLCGDTWHQSIDQAKEAAESWFGIRRNEWKDFA